MTLRTVTVAAPDTRRIWSKAMLVRASPRVLDVITHNPVRVRQDDAVLALFIHRRRATFATLVLNVHTDWSA